MTDHVGRMTFKILNVTSTNQSRRNQIAVRQMLNLVLNYETSSIFCRSRVVTTNIESQKLPRDLVEICKKVYIYGPDISVGAEDFTSSTPSYWNSLFQFHYHWVVCKVIVCSWSHSHCNNFIYTWYPLLFFQRRCGSKACPELLRCWNRTQDPLTSYPTPLSA